MAIARAYSKSRELVLDVTRRVAWFSYFSSESLLMSNACLWADRAMCAIPRDEHWSLAMSQIQVIKRAELTSPSWS
jgi:hypothetical protein